MYFGVHNICKSKMYDNNSTKDRMQGRGSRIMGSPGPQGDRPEWMGECNGKGNDRTMRKRTTDEEDRWKAREIPGATDRVASVERKENRIK